MVRRFIAFVCGNLARFGVGNTRPRNAKAFAEENQRGAAGWRTAHIASALGTPVLGLYAATWSRRSGPYNSLELCVDRYEEAAREFRGRAATELRWGHRIEEPGVMELVQPGDAIERLEYFLQRHS